MPVPIVVVWLATLLVSSLSKIWFVGSTATLLVIVPTVDGADRTMVIVVVVCAAIAPPVQVRTFCGSTAQPAKAGATA